MFMLLSKKNFGLITHRLVQCVVTHSNLLLSLKKTLKWSHTAPKAKTELLSYSTGYPFLWPLCGNTRILFVLADHASPITLNGMSVHETRL